MLKPGLEMIIGIKKDLVFGQAVVLGLGGIFVVVLKDVSTRVAPLREEDARAMLEELKGRALLEGVRGSLPRDKDALVEILVKVSRLAYEMEDLIQEMDINPLIVQARGDGAVAADALFVPVAQH
jgi:acyl-CoA synthetase (NDP forming)